MKFIESTRNVGVSRSWVFHSHEDSLKVDVILQFLILTVFIFPLEKGSGDTRYHPKITLIFIETTKQVGVSRSCVG